MFKGKTFYEKQFLIQYYCNLDISVGHTTIIIEKEAWIDQCNVSQY